MAKDKLQAAEVLRGMAADHLALADAAEALERIGSLDQAEVESRARLDAVRAEVLKAEHARDGAHEEGRKAKKRAELDAGALLGKAKAEAQAIAERAERDAGVAVQSAKAEAARIRAEADAAVQTAQAGVLKAKAELEALGRELEQLAAAREARKAELADLNGRLDLARAQAQQIIGRVQ